MRTSKKYAALAVSSALASTLFVGTTSNVGAEESFDRIPLTYKGKQLSNGSGSACLGAQMERGIITDGVLMAEAKASVCEDAKTFEAKKAIPQPSWAASLFGAVLTPASRVAADLMTAQGALDYGKAAKSGALADKTNIDNSIKDSGNSSPSLSSIVSVSAAGGDGGAGGAGGSATGGSATGGSATGGSATGGSSSSSATGGSATGGSSSSDATVKGSGNSNVDVDNSTGGGHHGGGCDHGCDIITPKEAKRAQTVAKILPAHQAHV